MPILNVPKKLDQILLGSGFSTDGSTFLAKNPQILANVSSASSVQLPKHTSNSNI